jgi:RimJ/RimL family protein N-acetyltransferase
VAIEFWGLAVIRATTQDAPEIAAFLNAHQDTSMFALSNLAQHGMDGGHPRALRCWLRREDGQITAVMTVTEEGMAMPQCPSFQADDWGQATAATDGLALIGIIGPTAQARAFAAAAGLTAAPATLNRDEPFMALSLSDLVVHRGTDQIVPLADAPRQTMFDWMIAYQVEALESGPREAAVRAEHSLAAYLANNSHVVLMQGETPLAMTGFNARLPGIVQIGGVYVPPTLRNRGHARRAVALHLAQAQAEGVSRAVLFSASEAAARAYRGIGFRQTGDWTLCLFDGPQVVRNG